ncbi:MAG: hypothetical protein ACFFDK_01320 [Promethearchaeota archaeon]
MIDFLKELSLSDKAISLYKALYDKSSLTINEIHVLKPKLSKKELIEIINELFQTKLLIKIGSKDTSIIGHYIAVPPFSNIGDLISQIKDNIAGKETSAVKFETVIDNIFNKQSKIELENLYKDFQRLQNDVNNDITTIKKELEELLDQIEDKGEKIDLLDKYEKELKNIINSELASIVIIVLQMKSEFQDKLKKIGISDTQWNSLKDEIKNTLALGVHEKSGELGEIISEEFKDIRNSIEQKHIDVLKDRFEQKSIYLGILNMFKSEIDKFHKALLMKKNNVELDMKNLEKVLNSEIAKTFQKSIENASDNIISIENFFQTFLENSGTLFCSSVDNFWPIYSKAKIKEEILNYLKKSKEEIIVIVPKIEGYFPLKTLMGITEGPKIQIISSDAHESEIIQSLSSNNNIEFKKLVNSDFIGILSDNSYLILGLYQELEQDPLNNVIGVGTNNKQMVNFLKPIFLEKIQAAKYSKNLQINNGFNYIIRNINEIKGKKISKILQEILEIAFEKQGISLDVVELKLLISKLKNVNAPLDNDWKSHVIEKINEFNQKFSNLLLAIPPEFRAPAIDASIDETELKPLSKDIKLDYFDDVNAMFDLFLEKVDDLTGTEISNLIQNMIQMVIKFQGYSNILEWKENLSSISETLEEPFREKLKEEVTNWKTELLTPKTPIESYSIPSEQRLDVNIAQSAEVAKTEEEYYSPALEELTGSIEEEVSDIKEGRDVNVIYREISQNIEELNGSEISKKLQTIMDIVLETKGYSIGLKDMRQWISKLRMIKTPLVDEVLSTFKEKLIKWEKESI